MTDAIAIKQIPIDPQPLRGRGILLLCAALIAAALLAWQMSLQEQRDWTLVNTVDVSLAGEHYRLNQQQLVWLEEFSVLHFGASAEEARDIVTTQIDAQLAATFRAVEERLPLFADWYYSLSGEYSRISMAILERVDLVEGDFVARRAAAILFPDQVWTTTLSQLDANTSQLLQTHHARSRQNWLTQLQQRLSSQKVPAPIPGLSDAGSAPGALVLDNLAQQLQSLASTSMFETRMTLSTVGAVGVAGPALWRAVAARNAVTSARAVATAGAARGASRAGGAMAGAAVCLPGGPVALACAAVAGAATWIATDWLLLQADEALNREELLIGLQAGLQDLRSGLRAELLSAYDERIAALNDATLLEIETSFSPSRGQVP
ncbi:MAG: hypothetical protein Q8L60_08985 [Gammaproteobacteria bacterium]|nr:hypothetical protein [Gammaproteobacteria bacterium]MDP2140613.1 hypothetical protein [Gammaproteobacteria bacterium]MDP2347385.1 hypothetical protein [Gammaproteobacteria bacterium]